MKKSYIIEALTTNMGSYELITREWTLSSQGKQWARYNNKLQNKLLSNYNKNNHNYSVKQLKAATVILYSTMVNYKVNTSYLVKRLVGLAC